MVCGIMFGGNGYGSWIYNVVAGHTPKASDLPFMSFEKIYIA